MTCCSRSLFLKTRNRVCLFVHATALLAVACANLYGGQKPNILLIVSDDLAACLGCYGDEVCRTPNLDRLAASGVRFDRAYCQFPVCGPSRASFMSGLYPEQTGVMGNSYAEGSYSALNPTFAEHPSIGGLLRRNGYVSLRVSKIYHMGVPAGIEAGSAGGDDPDSWDRAFNIMAPETASPGELELLSPLAHHYGSNFARIIVPEGEEETQADVLAVSQAIAIMETRTRVRLPEAKHMLRPDEPFFLAVGLVRPHVPLIAPQRTFDHYPQESTALPEVPEGDLDDVPQAGHKKTNRTFYGMNETQQREAKAAYFASVEFMDEQVGRLLDTVDQLGSADETVIVFTSDHGFHLGEHGIWQKLTLFEESARVPLLIRAPGEEFSKGVGKSSPALVELVDLYPTLAELAGLADAVPDAVAGRSLVPLLREPQGKAADRHRDVAYVVTGEGGRSIRTRDWAYHRWIETGEEELYDLANDPDQFTNLARDADHADDLQHIQKLFEAKVASLEE